MTRTHRRIHRLIWPVVAILMVFGLAMALKLRPSPDAPAAPSATDTTS
jgi:hypothetical protein